MTACQNNDIVTTVKWIQPQSLKYRPKAKVQSAPNEVDPDHIKGLESHGSSLSLCCTISMLSGLIVKMTTATTLGLLFASMVVIYTSCYTSIISEYYWTIYLKRAVCFHVFSPFYKMTSSLSSDMVFHPA